MYGQATYGQGYFAASNKPSGGNMKRFALFFVLVLSLVFSTCEICPAQTVGKMPVIAYHCTWWQGVLKPSMIDFSSLTHIIIFPAQSVSSKSPFFDGSALSMGGDLAQIVPLAHAKGCKVILSVEGGYGDNGMAALTANAANCQTFVNAAIAYVKANSCDGVEVDWEFPRAGSEAGLHNLLTMFRAALNTMTPTGTLITSGYYSDLGAPYKVADENACVDYFVPMTYTMWQGAGSGPYKSGFDTPVNLPTQFSSYAGYSLSSPASGGPLTYLKDGYTPSKVAVSISFEGTKFGGVTTMGQAYSSWGFCSTVTKCLGSGYAPIPTAGRLWDAIAQAAYCISGSTVYSFQTVQSVTAISQWARANGFGAIMIYDLGCGYEATSGVSDPQALLHAVWAVASNGVTPPPVNVPTITSFTISTATLPAGGGNVTLAWATTDATSVAISGVAGTQAASGSIIVPVTASTTFSATATGAGGTSAAKSVSVTVAAPVPAPSGTFSASPLSLPYGGGRVTYSWTSQNATSVLLDGISVPLNGSLLDTVTESSVIPLELIGPGGTKSYSVSITVSTVVPPPACDTTGAYNRGYTAGYLAGYKAGRARQPINAQ